MPSASPKPARPIEPPLPEVKKCPLHKKNNKACKFCKTHAAAVEAHEAAKRKADEARLQLMKDALGGDKDASGGGPAAGIQCLPEAFRTQLDKSPFLEMLRLLSGGASNGRAAPPGGFDSHNRNGFPSPRGNRVPQR